MLTNWQVLRCDISSLMLGDYGSDTSVLPSTNIPSSWTVAVDW